MSRARIAVLDVDGTLVDTNYQHALAWYRAFRSLGETFPVWRIHRLIGMGGDQLVAALGGDDVEERIGDEARERWVEEVDPLMGEVGAAARRPRADRGAQGARAPGGAGQLGQAAPRRPRRWTCSTPATSPTAGPPARTSSRPSRRPDLLQVALEKIGEPADAPSVVVGDSVYDVEAAKNAGMPAIVVRSGGFGDDELRDAGAVAIYDTPADLTAALDETDLA